MRIRCYNPGCDVRLETGIPGEFEADSLKCPKCGAGGAAVVPLVDVHFLAPDERGPFADRTTGERRHVACQPDRAHLATIVDHFSASEDPAAVTCPACRRDVRWLAMAKALETVRSGFRVEPKDCCG